MSIDLERAKLLFEVIEKCASHPGKFPNLAAAALAELTEMNQPKEAVKAEPKQEPARRA